MARGDLSSGTLYTVNAVFHPANRRTFVKIAFF
jgi:hypothetical protein